jgi:hypothetical protein
VYPNGEVECDELVMLDSKDVVGRDSAGKESEEDLELCLSR